MYYHSYLKSAIEIINQYEGAIPLAAWLKNYFKQHKKFGSRDRKIISDLCFCFYRLGKGWMERSIEERILIAQFLCHGQSDFIKELMPQWNLHLTLSVAEKISFLGSAEAFCIFPFLSEVSNEIDKNLFVESHFIQPDLFLRIRPGKKSSVVKKLEAASVPFSVEESCIRLPNRSKVDDLVQIDNDVVIQDKSSQQVLNLLKEPLQLSTFTSWDCCAASGGKTILLHDQFPGAMLTVSDIRESILHNLRSRFKRAGIEKYTSFLADVSSSQFISKQKFDLVVCDAPCSGSGTWSRTPEQLAFFQKDRLDHYADLQKRITANAAKALRHGGHFLYITCSVFTKENEEVAEHIAQNEGLKLVRQEYYRGYTYKADTLFTALFSL